MKASPASNRRSLSGMPYFFIIARPRPFVNRGGAGREKYFRGRVFLLRPRFLFATIIP